MMKVVAEKFEMAKFFSFCVTEKDFFFIKIMTIVSVYKFYE